MLSIAHSAAQQWMDLEVRRILRNRRLGRQGSGRALSQSHHPQRNQPVLRRSRRVHRRHLLRVRQVVRLVRRLKWMKTIPLASAARRPVRRRYRQRKNRTRHISTESPAQCANRWDLCQNPPLENLFAVPMKSAWFPSSKRPKQGKKTAPANPHDCRMMWLRRRRPLKHRNPPNGIRC